MNSTFMATTIHTIMNVNHITRSPFIFSMYPIHPTADLNTAYAIKSGEGHVYCGIL